MSARSGRMPPASTIDVRLSWLSRARLARAAAAVSCADTFAPSPNIETSCLMMSTRLAFSIESRTSAPSACSLAFGLVLPSRFTSGAIPPASVMASRLAAWSAIANKALAASSCASCPFSPPSSLTSGAIAPASATSSPVLFGSAADDKVRRTLSAERVAPEPCGTCSVESLASAAAACFLLVSGSRA